MDIRCILSKKIVVFGTGKLAKLAALNIDNICYYIDNNSNKWGKLFEKKYIYNPAKLLEEEKANISIIVASSYYNEISEQLILIGFESEKEFFKLEDIVSNVENDNINLSPILKNQEIITHLIARINIGNNNALNEVGSLSEVEFKVYSQWGEDGIIQYLVNKIEIPFKTFVEFGVEDYKESNTRFLLINNNWNGLVIEMNSEYVDIIKKDEIYYKYNLIAENSYITRDNINSTLEANNIIGDIGLLSVDIDGNDYWIWERINVISPRIVICEFNAIFPKDKAYTIPYSDDFFRTNAHYSNLYYGASLKAFYNLAIKKGYKFVGTNSVCTNAFFVREDIVGDIKTFELKDYKFESKIRESRDINGNLTYLKGEERLKEIKGMKIFNLETNVIEDI